MGTGQTSFDFKDTDSLNLWKGYLEKNNIEYNMVTSYDETSGTYNYNITIK
ncbi:hypothetical protein KFE94_16770 [bacterium SCSIO 12643]|nr:hypothetical protein KFE94_16770 [bacterium SCSIO 12643]